MRALNVTEVAQKVDGTVPFIPNYTLVAINISGAAVTLQSSDAQAGTYTTIVAIPIGETREIVLNNLWIKLAAAGKLVLLGN
jgi:hypothetical protein